MPVVPTIDTSALRELNKALAEIDPALKRQVGKDIKTALGPFKDAVMRDIPQEAPISGFRSHRGRTHWGTTKIAAYASPGGGKGSIARLEVWSTPNNVAFKIIDLAGTRRKYSGTRRTHARVTRSGVTQVRQSATSSGEAMVRALDQRQPLSAGGKGGRYAWAAFIRKRPVLIGEVEKILDKFAKIAESRMYSSGS